MIVKSEENIRIPNVPIHQLSLESFLETARKSPNRKALIDATTGEGPTFSELHRASYCFSAFLKTIDFAERDVCAFVLRNCWEFYPLFFGTLLRGGAMTPVSPSFMEDEIAKQLIDSNSKVVVCEAISLPRVIAALDVCKTVKKIIIVGSYYGIRANNLVMFKDILKLTPDFYERQKRPNMDKDICYLPYSSGTTGPPKGVMHCHKAVLTMTEVFRHYIVNQSLPKIQRFWNFDNEYFPGILPFYHNFGFISTLSTIIAGGTVVYIKKFEPEGFFELLQNYKVKFSFVVPPVLVLMSKTPLLDKYDLSSLRFLVSGAAPLSGDVILTVKKRLPNIGDVAQGFGMTELACAAFVPQFGEGSPKSSGKLLPNLEAKIVDPETGKLLGRNTVGELCVRGPTQLIGYLGRPEATKDIFDSQGFVKTGDIAYFDEQNFLYVVDRRKELIKVKGLQVAPAELEALLLTCKLVKDAAVIGVPDDRQGEVPKAYVVRFSPSTTENDIKEFVKSRVAKYKQLTGGVEFIDEIPKSPSGKILRRELRDLESKKKTNSLAKL
ncbi:unnamed protein product [Bursaphelenchus xylophilus]|uniref:(pine wood nematode) hypothetical protein n=1 Tax=Bursaphelenchus xylophilus TaxID=6326 RepID=A0A1I7S5H0_BURXY|nr:unnamed protein product [Bursaphelenchus xylophilus]CAG9118070.1 unnamed protein product [Bursaphelenchus xylophilus]